ncbi:MAG TPA: hypothetical protein PKD78_15050, partial [Saprospiraceae bacterium]|nr:hypothetical protein [Saprospiraceae bacterium]
QISAAPLHLLPPPQDTFVLRDTFCASQTILIGNQFFDPSNPKGIVVLPGGGAGGKDSIIRVDLTFAQPVVRDLTGTFCEGDTLLINGRAYHAGFYIGQEIVQGGAKNGCDSIININLSFVKRGVYEYKATICEGDTVRFNGQVYDMFRREGETLLPHASANGCDSLVRVKLTVITPPFSMLRRTLCPDEFLLVNGTRYDANNRFGLEILENASSTGCDSLVTIELDFKQLYVYLGEDTTLVQGDILCLEPLFGFEPVSVVWTPSTPPSDSCLMPMSSITYTITAQDSAGCVVRDDLRIAVRRENRVYAPTAFKPEARHPNNRFYLSADPVVRRIRRMLIVDRWGEIVFEAQNIDPDIPELGWDGYFRGQIAHVDTYTFWAELEKTDGSVFEKAGSFVLVR